MNQLSLIKPNQNFDPIGPTFLKSLYHKFHSKQLHLCASGFLFFIERCPQRNNDFTRSLFFLMMRICNDTDKSTEEFIQINKGIVYVEGWQTYRVHTWDERARPRRGRWGRVVEMKEERWSYRVWEGILGFLGPLGWVDIFLIKISSVRTG